MSIERSSSGCLGIIGVGHLATTMVMGLLKNGWRAEEIVLAPRGHSAELAAQHGIFRAPDNAAVVERADLVLLAVRSADAVSALAGLPWRRGQLVLSACAGVPISALGAVAAPAQVSRIMPLTASELGASPTAIFPPTPAAQRLLDAIGTTITLDNEGQFEVCTVSAAVHGWILMLVRETCDWIENADVPAPIARALVAQTCVATGRIINEKEAPMAELLATLATPGGITEAGLKHLDAAHVPEAWRAACDVVFKRLTDE
ncbi:MAG: pyrroline-5-carboxylate reductase dimerization domain-containing protein [Pseudomonadota bacterium]